MNIKSRLLKAHKELQEIANNTTDGNDTILINLRKWYLAHMRVIDPELTEKSHEIQLLLSEKISNIPLTQTSKKYFFRRANELKLEKRKYFSSDISFLIRELIVHKDENAVCTRCQMMGYDIEYLTDRQTKQVVKVCQWCNNATTIDGEEYTVQGKLYPSTKEELLQTGIIDFT